MDMDGQVGLATRHWVLRLRGYRFPVNTPDYYAAVVCLLIGQVG